MECECEWSASVNGVLVGMECEWEWSVSGNGVRVGIFESTTH